MYKSVKCFSYADDREAKITLVNFTSNLFKRNAYLKSSQKFNEGLKEKAI